MTDTRELILARLLEVLRGVDGVLAVGRNVADVPGLTRPAVLLHDGREDFRDAPEQERYAQIQRVELTPMLTINAGADAPAVGTLLNLLRAHLVPAVVNDAGLRLLVGTSGRIRFHSCERLQAGPESKEGRMEITFVFTYLLKITDLLP